MAPENDDIRELIPGQPECRLLSHVLNRPEKTNTFTVAVLRCVVHVIIPRLAAGGLDQDSTERGKTATKTTLATSEDSPCFETILYDAMDRWWGPGILVIKKLLASARSLDGAQIWARLQTNTENGKVEAIIDGDLLGDMLMPRVPSLKPEEYSSVPHLELGSLAYTGIYKLGVWKVDIDWPSKHAYDRPTPKHAIFKSVAVPADIFPPEATALKCWKRMVSEITTLLKIPPHPQIVQPLAIVVLKQDGQADTLVGWIMPKYAGSIWAFWDRYDLGWAIPLVQDAAEALRHCHRAGVYHGDIAVDNVLLKNSLPTAAPF
ncbi:unnamed protein product [Tilletia controversa]|uniref:Protein kinase domain-containing protein n=3 Tax=Tilletia TaxID=13289 RepID=A0A8X7SX54_9BASI|nr:hypothetical protein CF336_g3499 [Tilletia laevis]KAE8199636.1 hypothetical protein CF328_g3191 [Tilletia controversa]KAE8253364.1 hypothetical protein A4X03_0g5919 [Tilletia caries]KAE8204466.1 hypothetical protein CF335_g2647 [Tilletia laevis]KAE8248158.1 hypothetical protein A4X06_0g3914 [Tilletia controversa]